MRLADKPAAQAILAGTVFLVFSGSLAQATVTDLADLAAGHASIQYQWTFETGAYGAFKDARIGGVDLVDAQSDAAYAATQVAGYDASTTAMQTYRFDGDRDHGAALRTEGDISIPTTGTIEYIFKADTKDEGGYMASAVVGPDRHYFGYDSSSISSTVSVGFGDPGQYQDLLGGSTGVAYNEGDWYYVAISYAPSGTSNTTFSAYVANLSSGATSATPTITGWNPADVAGGSALFGIGCYGKDGNHYLDGSMDQVAIYGAVLSAAEINDHVAAIQQQPDLRCDLSYPDYNAPGTDPQWMADASSWNNDAVLGSSSADTTYDPSPGRYGFVFDPSGGGDMLTLQRNDSLRVADIGHDTDMSIEMWLKADEIVNNRALVDGRTSGTRGWALWLNGDGSLTLKFYAGSSGSWTIQSDPGLMTATTDLEHLVVSLDADSSGGGLVSFYLDGQLWGSEVAYSGASAYVDPADVPYIIGNHANLTTSLTGFGGEIGAFRLYRIAMDSGQVMEHYVNERSLFASSVPEPSSWLLVLLAGASLAAFRRGRR